MARTDIPCAARSRISWISWGVIDGLLEKSEFGDELTPAGFEDAPLRVGEGAEVRGRELVERAFEIVEARGDAGGGGAQGRGALLARARQGASRIAQELLAGRRAGGPVGDQERLRLARRERVALDGPGEAQLLRGGEDGQRAGHREREAPTVDARGKLGRQPPREREPPLHPSFFLAQVLGDRGHREAVIDERGDDARFVHGAGSLRWRVGFEKPRFHRRTLDRLHDDGHLGAAFPSPQGQALEAVEDLVGAIADCRDAKWHGRQRACTVGSLAAKRRERVLQARDGDKHHRVVSGSGSSWYIG
ncbi:MAG: hypothetical protein HYY16_19100 [Planctomycetes bacterium]|nr:hypothetical protein [Planctomycetota bacterium]